GIFDQLTVSDPDHNNPNADRQTVTVMVGNDASLYGTFLLPGFAVTNVSSTKVYTKSNLTPADAQTALRSASFTPFANQMQVGIYDFDVKVEVHDSTSPTPLQAVPKEGPVYVEAVNDPPVVDASTAASTIPDNAEAQPFRLLVSDPD